MTERKMGL